MGMIEDKYKDKNPFKTPDRYFEGLTDKVMDKIKEDEIPAKSKIAPMFKTFMWMAASFVIIFGIGRIVIPLAMDPTQRIQGSSSQSLVIEKEQVQYDELDDLDLSDEDIINYLSEQSVDDFDLIAEL